MAIMGLSCADFGWPLVQHRSNLRLISDLDYTHYASQGFDATEIEPPLTRARHIHVRGGSQASVQASFDDNGVDYGRVVRPRRRSDTADTLASEYVWTP